MGVTTVSLNKDAELYLERIKQVEPLFNLSEFVRNELEIKATGKGMGSESVLRSKINEESLKIELALKNKELFLKQLERLQKEEKESAIKREKERKEAEESESYKKYIKEREEAITSYFAEHGLEEYRKGKKEGKWSSVGDFYENYIKTLSQ